LTTPRRTQITRLHCMDTPRTESEMGSDPIEAETLDHVLGFVNTLRRRPLQEFESFSNGPAAYWLFRVPRHRDDGFVNRLYSGFNSGSRALYCGKATSTGLRARMRCHAKGLDEAGLDPRDFYVAARTCSTWAWATYLEAVSLEVGQGGKFFPWAGSGFGNRSTGARRNQAPSMFDTLHEGRRARRSGDELARGLAALTVAISGTLSVPSALRWAPLSQELTKRC
jgi:hypothetical protein